MMKNGLMFANPNYQLIPDAPDENCPDGSYEDIYEGLDVSCRFNRKLSVRSRRKYASLDPASMGVDLDLETTPMLSSNTDKNLNESSVLEAISKDVLDNGNSIFDSNDNKDMGKRSPFQEYNLSLEPKKDKSPVAESENPFCNFKKVNPKSLTEKLALNVSSEVESLPIGWEKHEDDSGPYYWHITSGTIQRDPPLTQSPLSKSYLQLNQELELASSKIESHVRMRKRSGEKNSLYRKSVLGVPSFDEKVKRNCLDGPCTLTSDKRPIRFAVRSLGWVEIAETDLTPERSSKAVNKCIVDLSMGRNDILDVVGRWGDGKDLFMDLDDYSLRLMNTHDLTILNTQSVHTIRVWGVGRDNGRDFAYVARDRSTQKYMCHVFRCDIPARIIANTLRDICKKIMIERSLNKAPPPPARPNHFPAEEQLLAAAPPGEKGSSLIVGHLFPTPMEEPKKVMKAFYLGCTNVLKATGVDVLHEAIEKVATAAVPKKVNVAVAPSTITVTEPGENGKQLAECRVRFLSFLGIGKNVKHCGFIEHTAKEEFVAHVFYCEPSSGALCKTIEAACKLRYQKCLDSHRQESDSKPPEAPKKGLKTTLKNVFGALL